jgi:LPXTG-motif cell wall-anchored protein
VTATPAPLAGGTLPTQTRPGAEYAPGGNAANTFEVRPGHSYTLSEAAADPTRPLAYRQLRLERLTGTTWTPVSSSTISAPAAGQTAIYRFVNAPVTPTTLPLTGGASTDAFLIAGGSVMLLAVFLAIAHTWRRSRRRPI